MRILTTYNKTGGRRRRGVTLVEMMVAVGITVLMLAATGVVFKSAGAAAGKANAYSEMMQQVRVLCRQLENDFKGLRPDMPMAVIFETEDPTDPTSLRQDRIVFFANGDFQTVGGVSGNLARIFYGQARDKFEMPEHLDNPNAPWRRILTRRYKILNPGGYPPANDDSWVNAMGIPNWNGWQNVGPEEFDDELLESSTASYWKTEDPQNFIEYHFRTWDGVSLKAPGWPLSMVRRPDVREIQDQVEKRLIRSDALQQLYMLPDVGEFRIEAWYEYQQGWGQITTSPTAIYWNIEDIDGLVGGQTITGMYWFSEYDIAAFIAALGAPQPVIMWPKALRFTFTLYDRDRRYFPEGMTFTYIVKLPRRK